MIEICSKKYTMSLFSKVSSDFLKKNPLHLLGKSKFSRRTSVSDEMDIRGYKYDEDANITQLLDRTTRNIFGGCDCDGFKSAGFSSSGQGVVNDEVIDFFKSRKSPEKSGFSSIKEALNKQKEAFKRTTEHVSSLIRGKATKERTPTVSGKPPKAMPSATQRQMELGPKRQHREQPRKPNVRANRSSSSQQQKQSSAQPTVTSRYFQPQPSHKQQILEQNYPTEQRYGKQPSEQPQEQYQTEIQQEHYQTQHQPEHYQTQHQPEHYQTQQQTKQQTKQQPSYPGQNVPPKSQ